MLEDIEEWEVPEDLDDAYEQKRVIIARVDDIKVQLGDRTRKSKFNTSNEYDTWRRNASFRLNNELQRLRLVKGWIRRKNLKDSYELI